MGMRAMHDGPVAPQGWSRSPRGTSEVFVSNVIGVGPDGEYALIGGQCAHCGRAMFPLRDMCMHCQAPDPDPMPLCGFDRVRRVEQPRLVPLAGDGQQLEGVAGLHA